MKRRTQTTINWPFGLPNLMPSISYPATSVAPGLSLSGLTLKTVDDGRMKGYRNRLFIKFTSIRSRVPDDHREEIERRLNYLAKNTIIGSRLSSGASSSSAMDGSEVEGDQGTINFEYVFHQKEGENFCEGALRVGHATFKEFTQPSEWQAFLNFDVMQTSWVNHNGKWMTYVEYLKEQAKEFFPVSGSVC